MNRPALRWAVVIVDLDPSVGHEQSGERRAVIVSYEPLHRAGMIAACPVTTSRAVPAIPAMSPSRADRAGRHARASSCVTKLRTLSLERVRRVTGRVSDPDIRASVRAYLARHLGLDIPAPQDGAAGDDVVARPT